MADELQLIAGVKLDLSGVQAQWKRFEASVSTARLGTNFGGLTSATKDFDRALGSATNRVVAFASAAAVFGVIERSFRAFVSATTDVEDRLARINVNLNQTSDGLKTFGSAIFNIARDTGTSFDTAAKGAEELARQGLTATETLKRLKDALTLSRIAGIDSVEAVDSLTASINSFNKEALTSTEIVNKFAAVDTRFAVSSKDLQEAVSRVGSAASEAGVSFNELLAIVTSVQQTTARGGATIGNALKTIFTRVGRPEVLDQLQQLGVATKDIAGNTLPAVKVLQNLAGVYDNLSAAQKNVVSREVAGTYQINILKAALADLGKQYSTYNSALKTAAGATDEATRKNEALNQTLKSTFNAAKQSATQFFAAIGDQKFNSITKGLLDNIEGVRKFLSGEVGGNVGKSLGDGIIRGLSNILTGPALLAVANILFNAFRKVVSVIGSDIQSLVGINRESNQRIEIQRRINGLLSQATAEEIAQYRAARNVLEAKEAILAINLRIAQTDLIGTPVQNAFLGRSGGLSKITLPRIPTLADPLQAAVNREVAAGAPPGQIYVSSDARVASPNNPNGIVVANRRDEPYGAYQGVNRVLAEGGDPKQAGLPNFAVPNFAPGDALFGGGSMIGFGGEGSVYRSNRRKDLVFKRFHKEYAPEEGIKREFEMIKAAQAAGLPVTPVRGSLKRSLARGGLVKPYVEGFEASALNKYEPGVGQSVADRLHDLFKGKGFNSNGDLLGGGNIRIKGDINHYRRLLNTVGSDEVVKMASQNASVYDLGTFSRAPNFARRIPNFARSVPNFADNALPSRPITGVDYRQLGRGNQKISRELVDQLNQALKEQTASVKEGTDRWKEIETKLKKAAEFLNPQDLRDYAVRLKTAGSKILGGSTDRATPEQLAANFPARDVGSARHLNEYRRTNATTPALARELIGGPDLNAPYQFSRQDQRLRDAEAARLRGLRVARDSSRAHIGDDLISRAVDYDARFARPREEFLSKQKTTRSASAFDKLTTRFTKGETLTPAQSKFINDELQRRSTLVARERIAPGASEGVIQEAARGIRNSARRDLNNAANAPVKIKQQQESEAAQFQRQAKLEQRRQNRASNVFYAGFGASLAAGFVPEVANGLGVNQRGGSAGGIATGAIGGALQGFGIGSGFGPVGAGVGAAVGGLIGIFSKLSKSSEELNEEIEKGVSVQQNNVEAISQFLKLDADLKDAGNVSEETRKRFSTQQAEALKGVDPESRAKLLKGGLSDDEKAAVLAQAQEKVSQKVASGNVASGALQANTKGVFEKLDTLLNSRVGQALSVPLLGFGANKVATFANGLTSDAFSGQKTKSQIGEGLSAFINKGNVGGIDQRFLNRSIAAGGGDIDKLTKIYASLGQEVTITKDNFVTFAEGLKNGVRRFEEFSKAVEAGTKEQQGRFVNFQRANAVSGLDSVFGTQRTGVAERGGIFSNARNSIAALTSGPLGLADTQSENDIEAIRLRGQAGISNLDRTAGAGLREKALSGALPPEIRESIGGQSDFSNIKTILEQQVKGGGSSSVSLEELSKASHELITAQNQLRAETEEAVKTRRASNLAEKAVIDATQRLNIGRNASLSGSAILNTAGANLRYQGFRGRTPRLGAEQLESFRQGNEELTNIIGAPEGDIRQRSNALDAKSRLNRLYQTGADFLASRTGNRYQDKTGVFKGSVENAFKNIQGDKSFDQVTRDYAARFSGGVSQLKDDIKNPNRATAGLPKVQDQFTELKELNLQQDSLLKQTSSLFDKVSKLLGSTNREMISRINGEIKLTSDVLSPDVLAAIQASIANSLQPIIQQKLKELDNKIDSNAGKPNPPSSVQQKPFAPNAAALQ